MIYFGETKAGAKDTIDDWKKILAATGVEGLWTWQIPGKKQVILQINDKTSVTITLPLTITYKFVGDKLNITFSKPNPIGHYKIFNKYAESISVGTDRIEIELLMSPNGYLDIK